jgi:hypothetical protein
VFNANVAAAPGSLRPDFSGAIRDMRNETRERFDRAKSEKLTLFTTSRADCFIMTLTS